MKLCCEEEGEFGKLSRSVHFRRPKFSDFRMTFFFSSLLLLTVL